MALRAFFAVELPETIRDEVAALQATLRAIGADVRWVEQANLHLTLKFLGDVEETSLPPLTTALANALAAHAPFPLHLDGIGAFPSATHPRVLWVGVGLGQEALAALAQTVEQVCIAQGLPAAEPPFSAHLTLGRVRAPGRPSARVRGLAPPIHHLHTFEFHNPTPVPVERVTLFRSRLSPHGPAYTPLAILPLTPQLDRVPQK